MRTIMIIPAKSFSRRIPRKNLKEFCGVPLVSWGAILGQTAKLVDETWITTDSEEIAEAVRPYGAQVMFRNYKDDHETSGTVPLMECFHRLHADGVITEDDIFVTHLCTYPVLRAHDIDRLVMALQTIQYFKTENITSIGFRIEHKTLIVNKKVEPGLGGGHTIVGHNDYSVLTNKCCTSSAWARCYITGQHGEGRYIPLELWQDHDVDTLPEWEFAELCMEGYILKGRGKEAYYEASGSKDSGEDKDAQGEVHRADS